MYHPERESFREKSEDWAALPSGEAALCQKYTGLCQFAHAPVDATAMMEAITPHPDAGGGRFQRPLHRIPFVPAICGVHTAVTANQARASAMDRNDISFFGYEEEYKDDLRFIPMRMRYRLDLAGLKIGLEAWQRLPLQDRLSLSAAPVATATEADGFRKRVNAALKACTALEAAETAPVDPAAWGNAVYAPESVRTACVAAGLRFDESAWKRMTDFQRYALLKLSASSRQPEAFARTWREIVSMPL
jgi:hypothetical protein